MTSAKIIDGKKLAQDMLDALQKEVLNSSAPPRFAVIKIGNNAASEIYITHKIKVAKQIGIQGIRYDLAENVSEKEVLDLISQLNADEALDGLMVQLPLPKGFNELKIISAIRPDKDIDGLTPENQGYLMLGNAFLQPATPQGVLHAIKSVRKNLTGLHAVIVGRSNIVGKPLIPLLLKENCSVSIVHSKTPDFTMFTKSADIVIMAAGSPQLLCSSAIKTGAIVIDVGINRIGKKVMGDVDFDLVKEKASAITPVPGGIGPLTIGYLMKNIVLAYRAKKG